MTIAGFGDVEAEDEWAMANHIVEVEADDKGELWRRHDIEGERVLAAAR